MLLPHWQKAWVNWHLPISDSRIMPNAEWATKPNAKGSYEDLHMTLWRMKNMLGACLTCLIAALPVLASMSLPAQPAVASSAHAAAVPRTIDAVWAGTGIVYDAVSVGPIVYIAYYNAQRRFTVARVDTETRTVANKTLDSRFEGWDAHNYVTLAYDRAGFLHVSGNMHTSPLVYARTLQPDGFDSLTQTQRMVGRTSRR